MRLVAITLSVLAVSACSTAVQNPKSASTEAAATPGTESDPAQQKICRDMDTTGSYGPRHACHTKAEWAKIDALS